MSHMRGEVYIYRVTVCEGVQKGFITSRTFEMGFEDGAKFGLTEMRLKWEF